MRSCHLLLAYLLAIGCSNQAPSPPPGTSVGSTPDAEGFVPIGIDDSGNQVAKSKDGQPSLLTGTDIERASDTFAVTLRMYSETRGYLFTNKSYRDFTLRFDVRWLNTEAITESDRPNANTGVLVFITGEHKVWPRCLEVQGKWSELAHIKSNARDVEVVVHDDEEARQRARKPIGEWNSIEIVAKDGALTSFLNGVKIAESEPTELRKGPIGFQAEGYDVEYRNVRIREASGG